MQSSNPEISETQMQHSVGLVGLGVMGGNLALNMERHGFPVAGYDLDAAKLRAFLDGPAAGKRIIGVGSPAALMAALEKPRRVLVMVPAWPAMDEAEQKGTGKWTRQNALDVRRSATTSARTPIAAWTGTACSTRSGSGATEVAPYVPTYANS